MKLFYTFACLVFILKSTLQQVMMYGEGNSLRIGNLLRLRDYRLDVVPLATLELQDFMKCLTFCVKTDECCCVNIKKQANEMVLCELLQHNKLQFPNNLTRDDSSSHWYTTDTSVCSPNPCKPSGSCVTTDSVSAPFACVCGSNAISGKYCEIYEKDHNFALLKPTAQSSTRGHPLGDMASKYAVDGIKATTCTRTGVPSCAHIDVGSNQWWRVDLQIEVPVIRVGITNRNEYSSTLNDFAIKIGSSLVNDGRDNPRCGDRHSVSLGEDKVFPCSPPLTGRYVVIQSFYASPMVFTEVEVFAG